MYGQVPFIELVYTCSLNTLWCFYCMCSIYLCGQKVNQDVLTLDEGDYDLSLIVYVSYVLF